MPDKPLRAFQKQRASAKRRGVRFLLSFEEWMELWEQSGFWPQRGKGADKYVMAREGDRGPYAVGNVKIITGRENLDHKTLRPSARSRMSRKGWRHAVATKQKMSENMLGNKNLLGHVPSKKTRKKLSLALKGRRRDELGRLI
jgi:hypothetical protein